MSEDIDYSEVLIDGTPHPAAAFTDPRKKWKAHIAYTRDHAKFAVKILEQAEEAVRQVLLKRSDLEKAEKPTEQAQQELIDAFNPFTDGGIEEWRHCVTFSFLTTEEGYADAVHAMDNIAETIRKAGGNVSFTRQRARRARLEGASARLEVREREFHDWARKEKKAVKKACPDYERLRPKFTVISADGERPESEIDEY
jgi:stalled ribosome rescue protein Dom34